MPDVKVRLNGVDLETLGLPTTSTARFYVTKPSGRGLPAVKRRALNLPFLHGERSYGLFYEARDITLEGTLHAWTFPDYQEALDKLKRLLSPVHQPTGYVSDLPKSVLWFADESTVQQGYAQSGTATTIVLASTASSLDDYYNDMRVEVLNGTNAGETLTIADYVGSSRTATIVGRWSASPSSSTLYRVLEDRFWNVVYDGQLDEQYLTNQWLNNKLAAVTLRFKADEPFSLSEPKARSMAPLGVASQFVTLENLGTFPTFPSVTFVGSATNPSFVHAVQNLVVHFDGNPEFSDIQTDPSSVASLTHLQGYVTGKIAQGLTTTGKPSLFGTRQPHDTMSLFSMTDQRSPNGASSAFLRTSYSNHFDARQGTIAWWQKATLPMSATPGNTAEQIPIFEANAVNYVVLGNSVTSDITTLGGIGFRSQEIQVADAGVWTHYALTWAQSEVVAGAATRLAFYRNGVAFYQNTTAGTAPSITDAVSLFLFTRSNSLGRFQGAVDDIAVWDVPLSENQVGSIGVGGYAAAGFQPESLKAYFPMDGSGNLTSGNQADFGICFDREENLVSMDAATATLDPLGGKGFYTAARENLAMAYVTDATTIRWETASVTAVGSHSLTVAYAAQATFTGRNTRISRNLAADGDMDTNSQSYWAPTNGTFGKQATVVKSGLRSGIIANTGAAQGFVRQAMTGLPVGQSLWVSLWTYPQSLWDGANVFVRDTDGTIITAATQPVSPGIWNFLEASWTNSTAATNFDILIPDATSGSTMAIDRVKVMQNLVLNGGLEGTYAAGVAPLWNVVAGTAAEETTLIHGGGSSQKISNASGLGKRVRRDTADAIVSGRWYCAAGWVRSDATEGVYLEDGNSGANVGLSSVQTIVANQWNRISAIWKSTGTNFFWTVGSSVGTVLYVDDAMCVPLEGVDLRALPVSVNQLYVTTQDYQGLYAAPEMETLVLSTATQKGIVWNPYEGGALVRFLPGFSSSLATTEGNKFLLRGSVHTSPNLVFDLVFRPSDGSFQFTHYGSTTTNSAVSVTSGRMQFSPFEPLEVAARWNTTTTNGDSRTIALYLNGTRIASTTTTIYSWGGGVGFLRIGTGGLTQEAEGIFDEVVCWAKDPGEEALLDIFQQRRPILNESSEVAYSGTLDMGDEVKIDPLVSTKASRVRLYDSSAGTTTNALGNVTFKGATTPILSASRAIVYFPNVVNGGARLDYRKRWV